MLALVISALIALGVISTPAEYENGMFDQHEVQIEQHLQMDITNTDLIGV